VERNGELKVGGRTVKLSRLDKVLFPETGFTKANLIDYYIRISRFVLPHLRNQPVTLKLFPDGIHGKSFYQKDAPAHMPKWVKTADVSRVSGESQIHYPLLNDLPSLVWSANMTNIELHTLLARAPKIEQPTMIMFDLDPGPPAGLIECTRVALWLRDLLDQLKLQCFVKSSGSKGLHFCVPLNTRVGYEETQPFAEALAKLLERQHPDLVVSVMAKARREGKVFIDWSQNVDFKSTVCVYSMRAKRERPFISMPLSWDDLEHALQRHDPSLLETEPDEAIRRCESSGDLFAPLLKLKQQIPRQWRQAIEALNLPERRGTPSKTDLSLNTYAAKRDFSQTREPPALSAPSKPGTASRLFVIQKHAARQLHYDFRIEMEGALKSWAVPKGPPYERNEKRLAMQVEDHPLDYARFEGTIPPGNYGAGTVMVWDIGTYEVMDGNIHQGKLHLILKGKKLKGEWILVQAARDDTKRTWFLIKGGDSMKPLSPRQDDRSALTSRPLEQIAKDNDAQWTSSSTRPSSRPALPRETNS
jgi:bifunctional non-homologous end joining protein LigD